MLAAKAAVMLLKDSCSVEPKTIRNEALLTILITNVLHHLPVTITPVTSLSGSILMQPIGLLKQLFIGFMLSHTILSP